MKIINHLKDYLFSFLLILFLATTVWISRPISAQAANPEPDRIATGVAEAKAISATLTADASEEDRFATRVAEAVAATLTAMGPSTIQNCNPEVTPAPSVTAVRGGDYGPTQHCAAKSGFATIELRNLVSKVKSLDFFVDGVPVITVKYKKYGCIYLEDGKHVFQWKDKNSHGQSNARSFFVNGSDGWYSGSTRSDGIRNPYDAWLDSNYNPPLHTAVPTAVPTLPPTAVP